MRRLVPALALVALAGAAVPLAPTPARAQLPDGWTFSVEGQVGGLIPLRQLGKNSGSDPRLVNYQVVAERQTSTTVGAGLVFTSPSNETTVRLRFASTVDGVISGRWGLCGDPDNPLGGGALCEPVETSSDIRSLSVDMGFLQGAPGDRIRASLHIGAGLRSYSFGTVACADPSDWEFICELTSEIWQDDGGISPFLMGGLRLNGDLGPAVLWIEGMDQVGRYQGGSDRADGNIQNDLSVTAGVSLRIF